MKCIQHNTDPDIFSLKLSSSVINEYGKYKMPPDSGWASLQSIHPCNILLTFSLFQKKPKSQERQGAIKIKVKSC